VPARRAARLQIPLEVFDPGAIALDNLFDVCDAVKVHLELVQLAQQLGVARNLRVCTVNDVSGAVVLHLSEHLGLLAEVLNVLLDVDHEPVEVAAQRGEGGAVEEEKALAAGTGRGAGAAGAIESCLALAENLNLFVGEAQLRVRHGVCGHGEELLGPDAQAACSCRAARLVLGASMARRGQRSVIAAMLHKLISEVRDRFGTGPGAAVWFGDGCLMTPGLVGLLLLVVLMVVVR
jgi:hypothetical protein